MPRASRPFVWRLSSHLLVLVAATCACACAHPATTASLAAPALPTQLSAPGIPAQRYATAIPSGPIVSGEHSRPLESAFARVAGARGVHVVGDPRLARLASWAAGQLTSAGKLPPQAALDWAARHLGLVEPNPHFVLLAGNDPQAVAAGFEDRLGAALAEHTYSHWGGAVLERANDIIYVAALSFRFLELGPVPRELPEGASIALSGKLTQGYSAPLLALTRPDGSVVRGEPGRGVAFSFRVPADARGVFRVELFGEGPRGVAPVANFPVYVGVAPKASLEIDMATEDPPIRDMQAAAERLLELANRERARAGAPALALDAQLSAVADAHVLDMLEHHFVGHTSPSTGTPAQRVERAGIRTGLVLENIGRGASLSEVHAGLMDSPGHRGALLHPLATHVGIAVRRAREPAASDASAVSDYLVTQVFIRVTPKLSGDVASQLLAAINRVRQKAQRKPLQADAYLSELAARAARGCFSVPAGDSSLLDRVHAELAHAPQSRGLQAVSMVLGNSLEDLAELDVLRSPDTRRIGLGVSQGDRPDALPNALCAVFLLAR